MSERDGGFAAYFAARSNAMRNTAYLLCGDWHRAEDLVQTSFVKLYRVWGRVVDERAKDAYLRKIILRTFLDERRRGFFRREEVRGEHDDLAAPATGSPEDQLMLLHALADVPPRQRAVLVMRFWEDMSVEETARAMRCSVGTVKSQCSRGLQTLRALVPDIAMTF